MDATCMDELLIYITAVKVGVPKLGRASGKCLTAETEVRKQKCGSEKKSHLLMSSALLTHVRPCSQRMTLSL